jgi:pSer/pThr/pTyr-binding forkhead associated (FHA) protein
MWENENAVTQQQHEQASTTYLVIQQGPQAGKRIEIWKDRTTIGRSRDCDIFLEDITVHRKQASIVLVAAGYVLLDDHGSGDSFVNGRPIKEQLLSDGDQLLFGNTQLTFFSQAAATRPIQLSSSRGRELYRRKTPDASTSSIARLELLDMQGAMRSFDLQPEMTIGRSRDCDIFLEDLAVSRLHASIQQLPDGGYELEDHRSATGTFVNGWAITRCRLNNGDVVQIGSSRLTVRLVRS